MRLPVAAGLVDAVHRAQRWAETAEQEALAAEMAAETAGSRSAGALRRAAGMLRAQGYTLGLLAAMFGREIRGEDYDEVTDPRVPTQP